MSPRQEGVKVETKAEAEALIPLFKFGRVLNQGQLVPIIFLCIDLQGRHYWRRWSK